MAQTQSTAFPQPSLQYSRFRVSPWLVLGIVGLGLFMDLLDSTIVNVSIPSITTDIHASLAQILWVLNAYILVYAVLLITAGRLGDMFGPKRLFMIGLVIFTAASAACGFAQTPEQLIIFRVIQGVGGALLAPQGLSLITSVFPPEQQGPAFGVWGSLGGLAAVAGPTLGGVLTTGFTWRAIFFVNLPTGIIALILAYLMMPERKSAWMHRLDWVGIIVASAGLFAIVFALIEGQAYNWGRITNDGAFSVGSIQASLISIPSLLAYGVILLIAFVLWEARHSEPLLPLSLFRDRNYSGSTLVMASVTFAMLGFFLPLIIFLQSVLGLSALDAGVAIVPMSLTSMVIAPIAGGLGTRVKPQYLLFGGLVVFAGGMALVKSVLSLSATGLSFTPMLIVAGLGMGFTFAPLVTVAMKHVAPTQMGSASGFLSTSQQLGATLGSSVVGAILQNRLAAELHTQAVHYAPRLPAAYRGRFVDGFSNVASSGLQVGRGQTGTSNLPQNLPPAVMHQLQGLATLVFDHAYLSAINSSLLFPIGSLAVGALVTLIVLIARRQPEGAAEQTPNEAPALATGR